MTASTAAARPYVPKTTLPADAAVDRALPTRRAHRSGARNMWAKVQRAQDRSACTRAAKIGAMALEMRAGTRSVKLDDEHRKQARRHERVRHL